MYCTISAIVSTMRWVFASSFARLPLMVSNCFKRVSSLLAIASSLYKYLTRANAKEMMWEEYAVPALMITFTLGVLLGINLGMLCIPRFFEPTTSCSPLPQNYIMKPAHQAPPVNPLRYPSGFTSKQLQQHDFVQHQPRRSQALGANIGRRAVGGSFSY